MADVYEITNQTRATDVGADGTIVPVWKVTFTSKPSGTVGSVSVPASMYSADEVDRLVRAQVAVVEAVAKL